MKNFLIFLTVILVSCATIRAHKGSRYPKTSIPNSKLYKVYKIDSINSFYLIYAKKDGALYKIVSKKENLMNCSRIKKDEEYEFVLHARSENRTVAGVKLLPQNSLLVDCFNYDDSTRICLERDSINDLYRADNIKGLCYIK